MGVASGVMPNTPRVLNNFQLRLEAHEASDSNFAVFLFCGIIRIFVPLSAYGGGVGGHAEHP
jgi:hypothetical protein